MLYDTPFNYIYKGYRPGIFQMRTGEFAYRPHRKKLYEAPTNITFNEIKNGAEIIKQKAKATTNIIKNIIK